MAVAAETKKSKWTSKKAQSKGPKKVVKKEPKSEKTEEKSRKDIKRERKERENPNYHVEMTLKKMWETLRSGLCGFSREIHYMCVMYMYVHVCLCM